MLDQREHEDLKRKAVFYDAFFGDPGPQSTETLKEWRRVCWRLDASKERVDRITAHIDSRMTVADKQAEDDAALDRLEELREASASGDD